MSWIRVEKAGKSERVAIVRTASGARVSWNGITREIRSESSSPASRVSTEREIRAPMTGRVVSVAASPGAAVRARDPLVVLEAMKMEYRLTAPRDGVIESVACKAGERVDLGSVLVTLAP